MRSPTTPTFATDTDARDDETVEVLVWRFTQLRRAGYDPIDATRLACALDVDLHGAVELRERGCPSATALRILL